ncbi:RDD family protein [Nocardiopsis trehalosi]|uniref:RDD family protein n=1 Tax=Nocardiopsis trehalosi TaxID=109329 RepID=UPI000833A78A|nr:RDD family protein [Nocardiopsis trehalosi]
MYDPGSAPHRPAAGPVPPAPGGAPAGAPATPAPFSPGLGAPGGAAPPFGAGPFGAPPPAAHGRPAPGTPLALGPRFGALLVDVVVYNAIVVVVYVVGMLLSTFTGLAVDYEAMNGGGAPPTAFMVGAITTITLAFTAAWCYVWLTHALGGRSLGKLLIGARVVSTDTGRPPGKGRAAARAAVQVLLGYTLLGALIDLAFAARDPRHRSLHDRAARTVVVHHR